MRRGSWPTKMEVQSRNKSDNAVSEIQTEFKWGYKRNSWLWRCWQYCLQESLDMQPKELSKGELNDTNEESGCDEKDEDVPEKKWHQQKISHLSNNQRYFMTLKGYNGSSSKLKSMISCQGMERMLAPYCKYRVRRSQALFKLFLVILSGANVLDYKVLNKYQFYYFLLPYKKVFKCFHKTF